jgi:hypothetical protein
MSGGTTVEKRVEEHLKDALDSETVASKDYHIRSALQAVVCEEARAETLEE